MRRSTPSSSAGCCSGEPSPDDDVAELRWFAPDALPAAEELAFECVRTALAAWRNGDR